MIRPSALNAWLIGAAVFFIVLAKGIDIFFDDTQLISKQHKTIQAYLQEQELAVEQLLAEEEFIALFYGSEQTKVEKKKEKTDKNYFHKIDYPFNICLYQNNEQIAWSNRIAFPDEKMLYELNNENPIFRKLSNGYYRIAKHELDNNAGDFAISLIPIKWTYSAALKHLKTQFEPTSKEIPAYIDIAKSPTDFPLVDRDGNTICYLAKNPEIKGKISDTKVLSFLLFFYSIAFLLLAYVLNNIALHLSSTRKAWVGACFLLFSVFGLRYLSILLGWTDRLSSLQIFQRTFSNTNFSIGDLLINIVLLLWVVIFFHRHSRSNAISTEQPPQVRFFLTILNYVSIVLALLLLISVFKGLVLNSGVPFDFKNVFNFEFYSIVAVIGIILLLFTLFIFCHRMMLAIRQILLSRHLRLAALGVSILISLPIIYLINLQIDARIIALVTFIFILTYDMFIDFNSPGLIWLVVWIIFFTAFSSGLLNTYNYDKELREEKFIAKALAEEQDTFALKGIKQFKAHLQQNEFLTTHTPSGIYSMIESSVFKENYLYNNYQFSLYPSTEEGDSIRTDTTVATVLDSWTLHEPNVYSTPDGRGHTTYILDISSTHNAPLYVHFNKRKPRSTTVYSEILSNKSFKNLTQLGKYNYAIYKVNALTNSSGETVNTISLVDSDGIEESWESRVFNNPPIIGGFERIGYDTYDDSLYNHDGRTYVLLSKERNGFFHPISLFSFIFSLLTLTVLIFAILNQKLKILPHNLNFDVGKKPSLKNRIQISTIILTLISFVTISFISSLFLRTNWIDYHDNRLKRKVTSVQLDAKNWLHHEDNSIDFLKALVPQLAKTHRIDVNLFDLRGNLIRSSQEDIYKQNILPRKMNGNAIFALGKSVNKDYYQTLDRIGDESFMTAFVPLESSEGEKIAYLEIPYYSKAKSLEDDISSFMGRLLNVYVFLLFIAGFFSVLVANSITKPLTAIGEKLQEVKVGKPNTPLHWETNDEIGSLVAEYNQMIKKLEDSAVLLAKSEREGAWREMAKQVAHEIKNPLTPMKLSIQYLNHAYHSQPDNIDGLMERVSKTLIEQIDNLAHIANEFSNFAKMPRANNKEFVINDLVSSVYELFKKQEHVDILLELPEYAYTVFADKQQLLQVLNNLIKNATEAIPSHRRGHIEVSLFQKEDMAVIRVSDNGMGIPKEMENKVFVPNFTTKNSGTGLGLAISKNIIESVNGKIYYETVFDVGTDFYVELPIERIEKMEMAY